SVRYVASRPLYRRPVPPLLNQLASGPPSASMLAARQPKRPARQFVMIQARGLVHQCKTLWQLNWKAPLVVADRRALPFSRPLIPPRRRTSCDRFNDQNRRAFLRGLQEIASQAVSRRRIQFINGKSCDYGGV